MYPKFNYKTGKLEITPPKKKSNPTPKTEKGKIASERLKDAWENAPDGAKKLTKADFKNTKSSNNISASPTYYSYTPEEKIKDKKLISKKIKDQEKETMIYNFDKDITQVPKEILYPELKLELTPKLPKIDAMFDKTIKEETPFIESKHQGLASMFDTTIGEDNPFVQPVQPVQKRKYVKKNAKVLLSTVEDNNKKYGKK